MDVVNEHYWYEMWHLDYDLHKKMSLRSIQEISRDEHVSIYADTDSLFVSLKPMIDHCEWKNLYFDNLNRLSKKYIILSEVLPIPNSPNCLGVARDVDEFIELLKLDYETVIIDGSFVKNRDLNKIIDNGAISIDIKWNWGDELQLIQGMDHFRFAQYFKDCLDDYAAKFGVANKEDFELEKISESIINLAKKKYIQHILMEDGIEYDRMDYIFPKGVELVRSSTPLFAREKIVDIVKYLFMNPDNFNIRELLKLVKSLRKEFELADIDDISMQTSCSKYKEKIVDDKQLPLRYLNGTHFAVKSAAYHNYLLNKNAPLQSKYSFIKSGNKIKYYMCKDFTINKTFAYIRGSFPYEFAPEIDFDEQFLRAILNPINSIIEPLGMPTITKRLSIIMDIFSRFGDDNIKDDDIDYLDTDD